MQFILSMYTYVHKYIPTYIQYVSQVTYPTNFVSFTIQLANKVAEVLYSASATFEIMPGNHLRIISTYIFMSIHIRIYTYV